jgi:hypothetical protein
MGVGTTGSVSASISTGGGGEIFTGNGETITNDRAVAGGSITVAIGDGETAAGVSGGEKVMVKGGASVGVR